MTPVIGPYSPIVRAGGWLITSGQIGVVPSSDPAVLVSGGAAAELHQTLANLEALLAGEGATLADVVVATLYLVDMSRFAELNAVWTEHFGEHRPARTAVAVAALPFGASVEVAAWALEPTGPLPEAS